MAGTNRCKGYEVNTIHLDSTTLDEETTRNALSRAAPAESGYSRTAIVLHWVLGLTVVAVFGVGFYMANQPFSGSASSSSQ